MAQYLPTAHIPDINPRRRELIEAFDTGSMVDLLNTLYKLAQDDWYSSLRGGHTQKRTAKASMEIMLRDRNCGQRHMLALLLSLPRPVIKAIILNTIGTMYATDPEFRKLFYKKDASAGIYLNTALKTATQGFTASDWKEIKQSVQCYIENEGVVIRADTLQWYKDAANEACGIDNAYGIRQVPGRQFRSNLGNRYWLGSADARAKMMIFREKMNDRIRPELDPSLSINQLQSPVEVGLAHYDLAGRMADHHPNSGLHRTVKPWGLFLSILKYFEEPAEVISLPILKVWDVELLMKGEILITLLGGALVEDGGFNPTQAGCSGNRAPAGSYKEELKEVFQENNWLDENLRVADAEAKSRKAAMEACSDFDTGILRHNIADLSKSITELRLARNELDKLLLEETKKEEDEIARLREHLEMLKEQRHRANRNIAFQGSVDSWLANDD